MPIRGIFYSGRSGSDIHLLHGERSRDLRVASLAFTEILPNGAEIGRFAKAYLDAHTGANEDVTLEFRATFPGILVGDEWTDGDIKVNQTTGEVSFVPGSGMPPSSPFNFIIEAVITRNDGGVAPADIQPALIRVHIHESATRLWLTPARMNVRRLTEAGDDRTRNRFTVRVEFNDGVVGDLTTHHNVTWGPAANVHNEAGEVGLLRIPAGVAAGTEVDIEATWSSAGGSVQGAAKMVVAPPWSSDPAMPLAHLVDGHPDAWAGTIHPDVVPNVLFVGDGFTIADQPAFGSIANKIVHDLKRDKLTRPYDVLATSMNYWRVSAPSASRGLSVRCEVFTVESGGKLFAMPVPPARAPPAAGVWTVEHLIYAVGLPMPTDVAPVGETAAQAATARSILRARWNTIARNPPTAAVVSDAVIDEWRLIGSRTFIDEIDAFPAMALGAPPAAGEQTPTPFLQLHPDRGGEIGLDSFYRALRAANNVAIAGSGPGAHLGILWAEDRPAFRFDNRSLVVLLAGCKGGRAQRTARHIDVSLESGNAWMLVTSTVVSGRRAVNLDQTTPLPATVDREVWRVMAHELGHSFGLGDEYVDLPGRFTGAEENLDLRGNLTSAAAVISAGNFSVDLIKWNWRRARKAAVLTGPIAPSGADFIVKVLLGEAFQFAAGDKVRLRVREWKKVLGRNPRECSTDLVVVGHNAAGDEITVRGSPNPVELSLFLEGSVIYIPVPLPDGSPGEARMIAPKIARYMQDNNRPLTPWPCNPAAQLGHKADGRANGSSHQIPAYDGYEGIWSHRNDVRVVGLYAGGQRLGCGIFHPAGSCMMRNSPTDASEFCAVCRFVMVDLIDPGRHFEIDRDYNKIYPK